MQEPDANEEGPQDLTFRRPKLWAAEKSSWLSCCLLKIHFKLKKWNLDACKLQANGAERGSAKLFSLFTTEKPYTRTRKGVCRSCMMYNVLLHSAALESLSSFQPAELIYSNYSWKLNCARCSAIASWLWYIPESSGKWTFQKRPVIISIPMLFCWPGIKSDKMIA